MQYAVAGGGVVDNGSSLMIDKLGSIEKAIRDMPQTEYNLEQVTDSLFQLMKRKRQGNTILSQKYRIQG